MIYFKPTLAALGAAILVAACGGGGDGPLGSQNTAPDRGQLMQTPPPRITSMTAADFKALLTASGADGLNLLQLSTGSQTGTFPCGIDVQYIKYGTTGGNGEKTDASGALMVPTGGDNCTKARPIVLYAHGTTITKSYNLANLTDKTNAAYEQAALLAAVFAAQGYIVVAPNYAGYDSSSLSYHPYLNADQQSKEMIDILAAAKTALPTLMNPATYSAKLFIAGYSEGGHVAMATQRAMEAAGTTVTAAAPMSGPYAMSSYTDAIFAGNVALGATVFTPLLFASYEKSYPSLNITPSDIFEPTYATGIDTLLPGAYDFTSVLLSGKLPATAFFSSTSPGPGFDAYTPAGAFGFGSGNLIKNTARAAYLTDAALNSTTPAYSLRIAAKTNDLRTGWAATGTPMKAPMLLCGGINDPTVFWAANTLVMASLWASYVPYQLVTVLDVDSPAGVPGADNPFFAAKYGFSQAKSALLAATDATTVMTSYHGGLVPPFCNAAAKGYFDLFLSPT